VVLRQGLRHGGIMEADEHLRLPPLPGDGHPASGHALRDLRPYRRLPGALSEALTDHYRRAHPETLTRPTQ
jgi:hypothetical protein